MERTIKLLLCDYNLLLMENLKKRLMSEGSFEINITDSGEKAMEMLSLHDYDTLICDLLLKDKDGLELLKYIKENNLRTRPIILSDILRRGIIKETINMGAWYFLPKNIEFNLLRDRIILISTLRNFEKFRFNEERQEFLKGDGITKFLIDLGFPTNCNGFTYLKDAVEFTKKDKTYLKAVTLKLYPEIGKKNDSTSSRVESSLRNIISITYNKSKIFKEFLTMYNLNNKRPTVTQVIKSMTDNLKENQYV